MTSARDVGGLFPHNDITATPAGDWASTNWSMVDGMFDIAHGAGLAAIWGNWARYVLKQNPCRFAQLAVNVLNVPTTGNDGSSMKASPAMEDFFVPVVCLPRSADVKSNLPTPKSKAGAQMQLYGQKG